MNPFLQVIPQKQVLIYRIKYLTKVYVLLLLEYFYLFHLMDLLIVLTGGILITAAKTHKEIQRVLLNKQQSG